jgi:hypothetical protein
VTDAEDQGALLEKMSSEDKDTLIARLWRDLQDERARSRALERRLSSGSAAAHVSEECAPSPLLKRLQQAARKPAAGRRFGSRRRLAFLSSRTLIAAAGIVALAFGVDFAVGKYQQYDLEQKRLADIDLQHAAFEGMFAEVVNVVYEPDGKSYRLTMRFTNDDGGRPLYVMQSPVRVFEQSGLSWREVPTRDAHGEAARVIKLTDTYTFDTIFEPNLKEWTELIPGYMHIRFESDSLVSERSDPEDDIVERRDRYYVYLKPHGADDEAIRQRMKLKGDPPVFMPMPPH